MRPLRFSVAVSKMSKRKSGYRDKRGKVPEGPHGLKTRKNAKPELNQTQTEGDEDENLKLEQAILVFLKLLVFLNVIKKMLFLVFL